MNMEIQAALNLPDETDAFLQISDIVFDHLSDSSIEALSEHEQVFYCIDTLMRTLTNGGITQFLYETGGQQLDRTLAALKAIKASKALALLETVQQSLKSPLPEDEDLRSDFVDNIEISDELSSLEEKLLNEEASLMKLTLKFVGQNLKSFK